MQIRIQSFIFFWGGYLTIFHGIILSFHRFIHALSKLLNLNFQCTKKNCPNGVMDHSIAKMYKTTNMRSRICMDLSVIPAVFGTTSALNYNKIRNFVLVINKKKGPAKPVSVALGSSSSRRNNAVQNTLDTRTPSKYVKWPYKKASNSNKFVQTSITIRPTGCPPTFMSKNTRGLAMIVEICLTNCKNLRGMKNERKQEVRRIESPPFKAAEHVSNAPP